MKLHLNLSLRRALLAAMAAVATFASSATAGVMHSDATYQTYTDFGQNKGRYVVGGNVNALLSHIREKEGGITIDYTDGNESFLISNEQGMISFNGTHDAGHSAVISPTFIATVLHNGSLDGSFSERTVGSSYAINYEAIDIRGSQNFRLAPTWGTGQYDYMLQRQSKVVTDVTWNQLTTLTNEQIENLDGGYIYHSGSGTMYQWDETNEKMVGKAGPYTFIIGAINGILNGQVHADGENISIHQNPDYIPNDGASVDNPLPNGVRPGDSGSPTFIYNPTTGKYEYIAAQQSAGAEAYGQARGNVEWTQETLNKFDVNIDMSEASTIHLGAVNKAGETITETLGDKAYSTTLYSGLATDAKGKEVGEYIGVQTGINTWTNLNDRKNLNNWYAYENKDYTWNSPTYGQVISDLNVSDADLFYTQNLVFTPSQSTNYIILDATVDLGIGYAEFNKGENMDKAVFNITAGSAGTMFNHAGYVINEGAEVHLKLTNPETHMTEWRKTGAGDLYIDGTGNTNALLNVGGSGKTYLNQTGGHAAYNVLVNSGATVVINGINQIERDLTFGAGGGTLDMNGNSMNWYTSDGESRDGFTIQALTEEAMITNTSKTPSTLTYMQGGNTTYKGSFADTATGALSVVYSGGGTWTLNGIHTDLSHWGNSGFTVANGKVILSGTNTVHGMGSATAINANRLQVENDWHYADARMNVEVAGGATFELGSHARLTGYVYLNDGGTFIIREAVKHQYEYVEGGSKLEDTYKYADYYGYKGDGSTDIYLAGSNSALKIEYSEGTTANTSIAAKITGKGSVSVDTGLSGGTLTLSGANTMSGTKTLISGGLIAESANALGNTSTNKWKVQEKGWIALHHHTGAELLGNIDSSSTGVLALSSDTKEQLNLSGHKSLYVGAETGKTIEYGEKGTTTELTAQAGAWRLGGGGGTLNVNFLLAGENKLIIGNTYSSGTVHLANTGNTFSGDIIIMGTGNLLTYADVSALGSARVALSYGNTLAMHQQSDLGLLKSGAQGIMAVADSFDVDLTGYEVALGAVGDVTFTDTLTVGDMYRLGGSGNLILDTALDSTKKILIDGQGNSGSAVTFAWENAYSGDIVAGGGMNLETPNSTGSVGIHAGHANTFAATNSVELQQGAVLYTDGHANMVVQNLTAQTGAGIVNNGTTASSLELRVTQNASIADGVLNDANNSASLSLVKTGEGNLSMAGNKSWSGGLTIQEGQVTVNAGNGGVGSSANKIQIEDKGTLRVEAGKVSYGNIGQTIVNQTITGTGTIVAASGGNMLLTQQAAGFEGTVHVTEGTRLYVGKDLTYSNASPNSYNNVQAFDNATIKVDSGSQVRVTNNFVHVSQVAVVSHADYTIAGSGLEKATSSELIHEGLIQGALSIDCGATIMGNVTLDENATIASWSKNPTESLYRPSRPDIYGRYYSITNGAAELSGHYGIKGYLGGTIRGQILGAGKDLTIAGCESMTITADSANTFRNLNIANGNGNNTEKFALCLDGGKALSQTYTALGTGNVTLNEGLILRLAGTGEENQAHVVYTYGNDIDAGANATLQSHNITNKLTGTVTTTGNLNLATDHGGVLHLAGGFAIAESAQNTTQTLTIAAGSSIRIGSGEGDSFSGNVIAGAGVTLALDSNTALSAGSTISGTDSLTLCLGGANAYTLGGIELNNSESVAESNLTLRFDFTSAPNVGTEEAWCFLTSSITADSLIVGIDLNMFDNIGKGDYVLVNDIGNTHFELAEGSSSRFSLSKDGSNLVLTVAADDRLVWTTGSGTTQTWDTSSANWYSEAEDDMIAFSAGTDVLLTSKGVEENNSPNARETIALATDVTAGSIMVQDSCYEITGEHKLSSKSLRLGEGADLKLSTSQAEFTQGVQVNNALLTVAETQLDASILVENNASVTLSGAISTGNITVDSAELSASNSTITGDLLLKNASANIDSDSQIIGNVRLTESEANISGSSTIHGSISVDTSSTLAMESTKLTGEISVGEGIFSTVNLKADNTKDSTYGQATLSGNIDAREGSSLSLIDGSVVLDGAISLDSLSIAGGKTVTIWNAAAASGADKNIKNVELGNGAILQTIDREEMTSSTHLGAVQLNGVGATIQDKHHSGSFTVDTLKLGDDVNSATLNLTKNAASTWSTVFKLGNETAEGGNFAGTIKLHQTNDGSKRSAFIILGNKDIARNAVIDLLDAKSADAHIGLGINTANATIAGLKSVATDVTSDGKLQAKLFSGTINEKEAWNTGDTSDPGTVGTLLRTLTIDTAAKGDYTFHGEVLSNLNLVKDGAGKQTFSGNSANFNGSIEILEGTLAFTGDALGMLGTASSVTVNGGTLDISSYDFSTGDSLSINNFSFSDTSVLALGNLQADTSYNFFNTALENWTSLGMENFSIGGIALSDLGRVSLSLGMDGSFSYSMGESLSLVWNGGQTGTWNKNPENAVWQNADTQAAAIFMNGDSVVFNSNADIQTEGNIIVNDMNIASGVELVTTGGIMILGNISTGEGSRWTLAGGTDQSLSTTHIAQVSSLNIAKGATLTVSDNNLAGCSMSNLSGEGTVVLNLSNANNILNLGSAFKGETYVTSGKLNLDKSQVGSALRLADGVNVTAAGITVSPDIVLEGLTSVANGNTTTFNGSITGDGTFVHGDSNGYFRFKDVVDLGGYKQLDKGGWARDTFHALATLGAVELSGAGYLAFRNDSNIGMLTVSNTAGLFFESNYTHTITNATIKGGKVHFNVALGSDEGSYGDKTASAQLGTTEIGTLTISGGTVNFNGNTTIESASIAGGTTTFASTADITSLTISGGTVKSTGATFGKEGGTITMTGGTIELNRNEANKEQTLLSSLVVNNTSGGTLKLKNSVGVESAERTLTSLTIAANNNLQIEQEGWNTIWNINDLSGTGNLTWFVDSDANHYTSSRMVFRGDGSDYSGTIKLDRNASVARTHQIYMEIAANDAVKGATVDLYGSSAGGVASLAINSSDVTMQGIVGNLHTHLYAGAAVVGGSGKDSMLKAAASSSAFNTLTIAGSDEYVFAGTVGTANDTASLNLAMTGAGKQTFSGTTYVGDVTVKKGTLALNGASTVRGDAVVSGGELQLNGNASVGGNMSVAKGATLSVADAFSVESAAGVDSSASAMLRGPVKITQATDTAATSLQGMGTTPTELSNALLSIASGASLRVEDMLITGGSRITGLEAVSYTTDAVSAPSVTLVDTTIALGGGNATVGSLQSLTVDIALQSVSSGTLDVTAGTSVLTVDSSALSNLLLTSSSSFVVDFGSLFAGTDLTNVDFLYLNFEGVSYEQPTSTNMVGMVDGQEYEAYYAQDSNTGWVGGVYFDVRVVPEPTTSTLSLLALAGLCARRRRKD